MLLVRLEHLRWRFPEYWMIAVSASAWVYLAVQQTEHVHRPSVAADLSHWGMMVAAMMLPLQIRAVRLTAERSLWSRRDRSTAGYVAGYCGAWILGGLPLAWADTAFHLTHRINWTAGAAIGLIVAAAWLVSPWKAIAARLCNRTSRLSPFGWRADLDCLRYGFSSAWRCAFNCWPLMIACWLCGHSLIMMLFAFGVAWADRHFAPNYKAQAILLAMVGLMFGLYAGFR
jgi:hypothetical protein